MKEEEEENLKSNSLFVKYNSIDAPNEKTISYLKMGGIKIFQNQIFFF